MAFYNVYILKDNVIINKSEIDNGILCKNTVESYQKLMQILNDEEELKYNSIFDFVVTYVDNDGNTNFVYSSRLNILGMCSDLGYLL